MGNNYNLEYTLLKKSNLTDRAPQSIIDYKIHIDGYENCECSGCLEKKSS